jgi:hypothetical protein
MPLRHASSQNFLSCRFASGFRFAGGSGRERDHAPAHLQRATFPPAHQPVHLEVHRATKFLKPQQPYVGGWRFTLGSQCRVAELSIRWTPRQKWWPLGRTLGNRPWPTFRPSRPDQRLIPATAEVGTVHLGGDLRIPFEGIVFGASSSLFNTASYNDRTPAARSTSASKASKLSYAWRALFSRSTPNGSHRPSQYPVLLAPVEGALGGGRLPRKPGEPQKRSDFPLAACTSSSSRRRRR